MVIIFLNIFLFVIVNKTKDITIITNMLKTQNEIKSNLMRFSSLHNTQEMIAFSFERAGITESVDNFRDVLAELVILKDILRTQISTVCKKNSMLSQKTDITLTDYSNTMHDITLLNTVYNALFDSVVIARTPGTSSSAKRVQSYREKMSESHYELSSKLNSSLSNLEKINNSFIREVERRVNDVRQVTITIFVGMTLFSILFGFFFSKAITNSLRRLKESANKIAKGDFDFDSSGYPNDEIGDLSKAFFNMAVDLKSAQEELIRSKRLAAIGEIVASVNHEINNPLMIISGNAQFLELSMESYPQEMKDRVKAILAETDRISLVTKKLQQLKNPVSENYTSSGEQMINLDRSS